MYSPGSILLPFVEMKKVDKDNCDNFNYSNMLSNKHLGKEKHHYFYKLKVARNLKYQRGLNILKNIGGSFIVICIFIPCGDFLYHLYILG